MRNELLRALKSERQFLRAGKAEGESNLLIHSTAKRGKTSQLF